MKNWKKIVFLLVVLAPSVFFLSRAFGSNSVSLEDDRLKVTGAGGFQVLWEDIDEVKMVDDLPETRNSGSFSLGLIKKGNFIRVSDEKEIRVIKNADRNFIHLETGIGEIYMNLNAEEETRGLYQELKAELSQE
jgi:hypothetical protein